MTTLDHQTDVRAGVTDSEIVIVALVTAKYFANKHRISLTVDRHSTSVGVHHSTSPN
jgi:hypothetical protein